MPTTLERSAMRKIYLRLLPFAVLAYVLAYVDRINISFAALTMRGDLDMSASAFGFAAGIAWINSLGNLGGFFGPWYVGVMKDLTGSFSGGLYGLALTGVLSALVCAFFLHIPDRTSPAAMSAVGAHAG